MQMLMLLVGGPTFNLSPLAQIAAGLGMVLVCVVGLVWSRSRSRDN